MRSGTIEATEIWKRFRADARTTYLQDELGRLVGRLRGGSGTGWRWVLKGIDVEAEPGASVGLVGANGSGKSTLLKILTRVMYPTAGGVAVTGRVGSLIELRAGMHPNLTGRENIHLTGSLMGLPRRHVARRFDEIVAFAELETAIDRQVKYYSSGMQMRLGFGVAAFLEPDVLLVDEVLAVGDASFQQRCLDRMRDVLHQGTTLIFVSHDLASVEATCRDGIWLHEGEVSARGGIRDVLGAYRRWVEGGENGSRTDGRIRVQAELAPAGGGIVRTNETLDISLSVTSADEHDAWFYLGVSEGTASPVFVINRFAHLTEGLTQLRCSVEHLPLPKGRYSLWLASHERGQAGVWGEELLPWHPVRQFEVFGPELDWPPRAVVRLAPVYVDAGWSVEQG
ncbi:MAG TPA: ABC transporter ATP-binding protein [Gaiellaceae bacterium]